MPTNERTIHLRGLSAFPVTPMDEQGRIDREGVQALVSRLVAAKVDSIGLLGSTGCYAYLTREERRRAIEAARAVSGDVPLLVGIGALRTDDAIRLAQDARAAGAAMGLLAPVSYTPLGDDEVFAHFTAVAREGGLPLCIYDNPSTTHFRFGPDLIGRLAAEPGIVALKTSAPEPPGASALLADLKARVPEDFSLGTSGDWNCAEALIAGGEAWYSVAGGLVPEPCLALTRAAQAGRVAEARRLNAALEPLWALFRRHTSLRVVHAGAELLGLCRATPPRPILPLGDEARREVAEVLRGLQAAASPAFPAAAS